MVCRRCRVGCGEGKYAGAGLFQAAVGSGKDNSGVVRQDVVDCNVEAVGVNYSPAACTVTAESSSWLTLTVEYETFERSQSA